jgi:S1-C subfamily serine protease
MEVVFGEGWTGTAADLRQLARLRGLVAIGFHGVPLDREALGVLGRLERLQQLELFGTGASDRDVAALAARLPAARIDVRQGGKLGVGALAFGGPCEVRTVEPGSAADQAGIRAGDVIMAVDGAPIVDFEGLTARLAGRRPGERLRLAVVREGRAAGDREQLELDVRLDAW